MRRAHAAPALFAIAGVLFAAPGLAADAASLLKDAKAKQAQRWATVDNYTVTIAIDVANGLQTSIYYEKMEVDGQVTFRMVSPAEFYATTSEKAGFPVDKEMMSEMAKGLDMLGDAVATGDGDMPPMDLRGMTSQMSLFAEAASKVEVGDGRAEATDAVRDFTEFTKRAKLAGTDKVAATSGSSPQMRDAYRLVADDLADIQLEQPQGDSKYTLQKVSLWVDKEHLVPLRLLMEGEVEAKGKKTPMTIEKLDLDYKQVGPLYESHTQMYKLSGMMAGLSEKEKKDLEKAKQEMEKAKAEMEKMPPQQKAMVEKMMKGQMEKFEAMMAGDAFTSVTKVQSIAINEGPPTAYGPGEMQVGGPAAVDFSHTLTVAGEDPAADLGIAARIPGHAEAIIGLIGIDAFPDAGGQVEIARATGHVHVGTGDNMVKVHIEKGTGVITVTERTGTRIVGTFTALLKGEVSEKGQTKPVDFSASGTFDTGAPAGPLKELRGSPIPANLFKQ